MLEVEATIYNLLSNDTIDEMFNFSPTMELIQ